MAVDSDVCVEVVANTEIAPEYFLMRLFGPANLARFRPGQFVMLGLSSHALSGEWTDRLDPLLPRAMSIRRAKKFQVPGSKFRVQQPETRNPKPGTWIAEVEILYKVCGRGTSLLAAMRPGRSLRVLGPLGNAFEVPRRAMEVVLVAGGIGVPPIAALAEMLADRGTGRRKAVTVLLGGRSKADLLCVPDFRRAGATIHVATEDGSAGHKGLATDLLEQYLNTPHPAPGTPSLPLPPPRGRDGWGGAPRTVLYACGPHPMLAALASIAEKYDLPYQASLEANMACGFGACMGCVVPVKGGERDRTYRLVCMDGPVFDGREILWPQPCREPGRTRA